MSPHKKAIVFVSGVSLMNAVAMMIVVPVLPKLVQSFTGDTASAARYVGVFATSFALVQFIASPILGSLSDRFGRRLVILASAFGQGVNFVLMALAPSLAWLFLARVVSGVTSGSAPAINAYIADVIPHDERAAHFGWISAANSAGFLMGPALGGILGSISPRLPFWVAAGLCLVNGLYGLLVLPESLKRDRRAPFSFARANPAAAFRFIGSRPQVRILTAVLMMLMLAQQCLPNTVVLYTDYRFGWSSAQVGAYLTAVGLGNILVQAFVLRRLVQRYGERAAVIAGFTSVTVAFLIYATAPIAPIFVLGAPFFAFTGLITPSMQAQLTRRVEKDEQGRLQGAIASITSLLGLFTPLLYTEVFAFAIGPGQSVLPAGSHMYLAAGFLAGGALMALRFMTGPSAQAPTLN
jgi:DHA1 family tetracycline resistance protein-like MFS transporter